MIFFIYGDDHYRVREHVSAIKEKATKAGVSVITIEAEGTTPQTLQDHLSSHSLFSAKRAVFIKNPFSEGSTEMKESLQQSLDKLPDDLTLVITEEGTPDRRTKLFSDLSKRAKSFEKQPFVGKALERWIHDRARTAGVEITDKAVELLATSVGSDLARVEAELEKLSLYADGRRVAPNDVSDLVDAQVPPGIFDLLDAVGTRRAQAGLLVERLITEGQDPLYILSMLAYQVRNLLLTRDLLEGQWTISPLQLARTLRLHPFVAEKTLAQAKRFTMEDLVTLHGNLTDIDHAIKTGAVEGADALVLLVHNASLVS